jgi:hypothetical protein
LRVSALFEVNDVICYYFLWWALREYPLHTEDKHTEFGFLVYLLGYISVIV